MLTPPVTTHVADIQARIAAIHARFAPPAPSSLPQGSFAEVLQDVQARAATSPASPRVVPGAAAALTLGESFGLRPFQAAPAAATVLPTEQGEQAVAFARDYLGVSYLWGGTDPDVGLDCSGLVQLVYRRLGVELPRVSRDQARAGQPVASLEEARPGDLIAFGDPVDHIGIYAGNGKMVVAPRRGDVVKVQDIYRTPSAIRRIVN